MSFISWADAVESGLSSDAALSLEHVGVSSPPRRVGKAAASSEAFDRLLSDLGENSRDGLNLAFKSAVGLGEHRAEEPTPATTPVPRAAVPPRAPQTTRLSFADLLKAQQGAPLGGSPLASVRVASKPTSTAAAAPATATATATSTPAKTAAAPTAAPAPSAAGSSTPSAFKPRTRKPKSGTRRKLAGPPQIRRKRGAIEMFRSPSRDESPRSPSRKPSSPAAGAGGGASASASASSSPSGKRTVTGSTLRVTSSPSTDRNPRDEKQRKVSDSPTAQPEGKAPIEELTQERINKRQRQIDIGKDTIGYKNYVKHVPKKHRDPKRSDHPVTPRKETQCSKRAWDGHIRKWRRQLHVWDPDTDSVAEPHDDGAAAGKE